MHYFGLLLGDDRLVTPLNIPKYYLLFLLIQHFDLS